MQKNSNAIIAIGCNSCSDFDFYHKKSTLLLVCNGKKAKFLILLLNLYANN